MYYLCFELMHSPAALLGSLASAWYLIKWLVGDLSRFEMLFACNHWLADLLLPATVSNQPAQSDLWPLTSTRHFPPRNCRLPDIFSISGPSSAGDGGENPSRSAAETLSPAPATTFTTFRLPRVSFLLRSDFEPQHVVLNTPTCFSAPELFILSYLCQQAIVGNFP